jgi:hypothetical protein
MPSVIMLSVVMLGVVMLGVVMLGVIVLTVIVLGVIMLSVVLPIVVVPFIPLAATKKSFMTFVPRFLTRPNGPTVKEKADLAARHDLFLHH